MQGLQLRRLSDYHRSCSAVALAGTRRGHRRCGTILEWLELCPPSATCRVGKHGPRLPALHPEFEPEYSWGSASANCWFQLCATSQLRLHRLVGAHPAPDPDEYLRGAATWSRPSTTTGRSAHTQPSAPNLSGRRPPSLSTTGTSSARGRARLACTISAMQDEREAGDDGGQHGQGLRSPAQPVRPLQTQLTALLNAATTSLPGRRRRPCSTRISTRLRPARGWRSGRTSATRARPLVNPGTDASFRVPASPAATLTTGNRTTTLEDVRQLAS